MAPSTLSRLESGARRLALDHLAPLAGALGVEVGDLLAPATADPRVRTRPHKVDGVTMHVLSRAQPGGLLVVRMDYPAERTVPDPRSHEGHEWLYVLSGRLRLVLGDDDLVLEPGEAAEFSTWTPHWTGAVDGPAQALGIFGPQGQRVHLRT
jgi:quercetin dioxygenase-like cupin family protein